MKLNAKQPCANHVRVLASLLLCLVLPVSAYAAPDTSDAALRREVRAFMAEIEWPRMVGVSLERGDIQLRAKKKIAQLDAATSRCIDTRYTSQRVLATLEAGYMKIYSDPAILAGITAFLRRPGNKAIIDKLALRTKSAGIKTAVAENNANPLAGLTQAQIDEQDAFAKSAAGKAFLANGPVQRQVQLEALDRLASDIVAECQKKNE